MPNNSNEDLAKLGPSPWPSVPGGIAQPDNGGECQGELEVRAGGGNGGKGGGGDAQTAGLGGWGKTHSVPLPPAV